MTYEEIKAATLHVYKKCNIYSFPINCFDVISFYGLKLKRYEDLSQKKKAACLELSEDSCTIGNTVFYKSDTLESRIRFSLMHELGHIVLSTNNEKDADMFATYLLAPRIAIEYANCKNENDVSNIFNLSNAASKYAFDDFRRWRRYTKTHKISNIDKLTYYHFFDKEEGLFIWKKSICKGCGSIVYNSIDSVCDKCNHISTQIKTMENLAFFKATHHVEVPDKDFRRAEHYWLYGDCY